MAVLSREQRNKLLSQSHYGKTTAGNGKTKRNVGFRKVATNNIELATKGGRVISSKFKDMLSKSAAINGISAGNIHRKEIERLEKNPDLMKSDFEHYHQTLFFADLYDDYPEYYDYFCSIPNGGFRLKAERWRIKAEGQKKGMPDTMFLYPASGFHALLIEFKKPFTCYESLSKARSAVRPHQIDKLNLFSQQGYATAVAFGAKEAMRIFKAYITSNDQFLKLELFFTHKTK